MEIIAIYTYISSCFKNQESNLVAYKANLIRIPVIYC